MSSGKAFLIDTTLCTACRGCQVACKQWNQLPATTTSNWGSMQNPKDLSYDTYKLVRFQEHNGPENKPVWYFFSDQCRHCLEPSCKEAVDGEVSGGILIDRQTGAVLFTDKLKETDPDNVINACPFDIPKAQEKTGLLAKCTMCVDRVHNGLLPACVKTCPTGSHEFRGPGQDGEDGQGTFGRSKNPFSQSHAYGIGRLEGFLPSGGRAQEVLHLRRSGSTACSDGPKDGPSKDRAVYQGTGRGVGYLRLKG